MTAWTAAVTFVSSVTRVSKRTKSTASSACIRTDTTPGIFFVPVTTCDAQVCHMSPSTSMEISRVSASDGAVSGLASAGAAGEGRRFDSSTAYRTRHKPSATLLP